MKIEKQDTCFSRKGKEQLFQGQEEFRKYHINRIRLEDKEKMSNHVHWHRWFEFFVCLEGNAEFEYAGKKCILNEGDGIFINVGVLHKKVLNQCEGIVILISPELIGDTYLYHSFIDPLVHESVFPGVKLSSEDEKQKKIIDLLMELYEIQSNNDETLPLIVLSTLTRIWKYFYDFFMIQKGKIYEDHRGQCVHDMLMFIKNHYVEDISLNDIAESQNISVSTCIRLFQEYVYITPNAYVNLYRLVKAKEMLKESNLNVTEISNQCGFQSSAYFTKMFKKQFGKTPSEYRKK